MKKKTSKNPKARKQDSPQPPDDLYHDDWLASNTKYILTIPPEEKQRRIQQQKADEEFFKKLIKKFEIKDVKGFHKFWANLEISMGFSYNSDEKSDDLLHVARLLDEVTNILGFGDPINSFRLGEVAPEMVSKLEEYREICIEKHQPAQNHAPVAHQMDVLVTHVGDYLTNVLEIPFTYHASYTKKENRAVEFLNRVGEHLELWHGIKIRGLDAAATRYRKKLNRAKKRPKLKTKKKHLRPTR